MSNPPGYIPEALAECLGEILDKVKTTCQNWETSDMDARVLATEVGMVLQAYQGKTLAVWMRNAYEDIAYIATWEEDRATVLYSSGLPVASMPVAMIADLSRELGNSRDPEINKMAHDTAMVRLLSQQRWSLGRCSSDTIALLNLTEESLPSAQTVGEMFRALRTEVQYRISVENVTTDTDMEFLKTLPGVTYLQICPQTKGYVHITFQNELYMNRANESLRRANLSVGWPLAGWDQVDNVEDDAMIAKAEAALEAMYAAQNLKALQSISQARRVSSRVVTASVEDLYLALSFNILVLIGKEAQYIYEERGAWQRKPDGTRDPKNRDYIAGRFFEDILQDMQNLEILGPLEEREGRKRLTPKSKLRRQISFARSHDGTKRILSGLREWRYDETVEGEFHQYFKMIHEKVELLRQWFTPLCLGEFMKEHTFRVRVSSMPKLIQNLLGVPCGIVSPIETPAARYTGLCKSWLPEKKFGFLTDSKTGIDYFCHFSHVSTPTQSLTPGDAVEFGIGESDKGLQAVRVFLTSARATAEFRMTPKVAYTNKSKAPLRRHMGVCKSWRCDKKFGFLTDSETGQDIFTHSSTVQTPTQELQEGDHVEFDVEDTKKGPNAINVTVVRKASPEYTNKQSTQRRSLGGAQQQGREASERLAGEGYQRKPPRGEAPTQNRGGGAWHGKSKAS